MTGVRGFVVAIILTVTPIPAAAAVDTTPPTVTSVTPASQATGVPTTARVMVTFSEPMDPATITETTVRLFRGLSSVPASVSYNATTQMATLTPDGTLNTTTSYIAMVLGGQSGVKDLAQNALATTRMWSFTTTSQACANPIVCENQLMGSLSSEWDIVGDGDPTIQGFTTDISVNKGASLAFKIDTRATAYRLDIYRMGYYGGRGARKVATIRPTVALPQVQPACLADAITGLLDCGNWATSVTWPVPTDAVSGIYFAKALREDTASAGSHIVFIVRDDGGGSDLLFQTSDTTWQAYNDYGGNNLYVGSAQLFGRAVKVSYNRPFTTHVINSQSWVFYSEYPMVRWLEANGYHVSYWSGVDTDRFGSTLPQHKVFMSVGHDEYWSGAQRANVEAARAGGVHLAFLSGNEMFWKTRWEPSIDGSSTAYRTLVSYKETHANEKVDPIGASVWTGTWRDPRFSPPADGGRPENAVSGTLFMVNGDTGTSFTMQVPQAFSDLRFWRNTAVASLPAGATASLGQNTVGFEWDIDPDNTARPPGLFRLSSTTINVPDSLLRDYGSTYGAGTATHTATFYRHASGALVFGAGTVQWSWGLDTVHTGEISTADPSMQQATVNLFADMGVQPGTLQPGLVPATASIDVTKPVSSIVTPSAGATLAAGQAFAITGTASDTGGVVAGIEISLDGGATWHRANGRNSWSYTWIPRIAGDVTLKSRAVDDSGNLGDPSSAVTVRVTGSACPCSIWDASAAVIVPSNPDTGAVEVGVRFRSDLAGVISGLRFYKGPTNTGTHVGNLWTSEGQRLASVTFTGETASGWQQANFATPVPISANTVYVASYYAPVGGYASDRGDFGAAGVDNPPLQALGPPTSVNGVYAYGPSSTFPALSYKATNYWVDVVFDVVGNDNTPPTVAAVSPASEASGVNTATAVTARFSEAMTASTINTGTFELRDPSNTLVPASVAYSATTNVATLTPSAPLTAGTRYTATVRGGTADPRVKDLAGNALAANFTWSFTTAAAPTCPCSIWSLATTPAVSAEADNGAVELGVKFRSDVAGVITGIRFYKGAGNGGTHVGSLWTSTGQKLGSVTFTGETASGWQQANFPTPISIAANTIYVASYFAPLGHYAVNRPYFATAGVDNPPLHAVASPVSPNGLYAYAATSTFPTNTYQDSNYWVDVVFNLAGPDTTPPTVTAATPPEGTTGVSATTTVTVTFSETMTAGTISTATFELRDPSNTLVPASVAYSATTNVATLTPSAPLAAGMRYTATVRGGTVDPRVKDLAGNALAANFTWSFTTAAAPTCPCSIWSLTTTPAVSAEADNGAVELGVKFRSDVAGVITGIRFYKGAGNGGTHVGSLWTSTGQKLGSVTFTGETASGWQQANFPTPISIAANTIYVASYFAPLGHYAVNRPYFATVGVDNPPLHAVASPVSPNGLYAYAATSTFPTNTYQDSNYWVDVVFDFAASGSTLAAAPATTSSGVVAAGSTPAAVGVDSAAAITVGDRIAGNFPDATGHSAQSHLIYAANSGVWWLFTLTSEADSHGGTGHVIKSFRSSGPDILGTTWIPGPVSTAAQAATGGFMGGGRALSVIYIDNHPVDVVHAEIAMATDGQPAVTAHVRAVVTADTVKWEPWIYRQEVASVWTLPRTTALGVSTGKRVHSGGPTLHAATLANARTATTSDTGPTWTGQFSEVAVIDGSVFGTHSFAFAPLPGNVMLAVYDSGDGTDGLIENLRFKRSNADGSWPGPGGAAASGDGDVFASPATIDQNDWCLVTSSTAISVFRVNADGSGIDAAQYSASSNSWSAMAVPPPALRAGQELKAGGGLFGATDGARVWLFGIAPDAANTILYTRFDGTSWTPWAPVPGTDTGTRPRHALAGYPFVSAGQIGLIWTEESASQPGTYDVRTISLSTE